MPIVPREEQVRGLPSVSVGPSLSPNAPAEAFGGGQAQTNITRGFANLGDQVGGIIQNAQDDAKKTRVLSAYGKLAEKAQVLYDDPTEGAISKKGIDALGAMTDYRQKFDDYANEVEADLNDDEKAMLSEKKRTLSLQLNKQLMGHANGEYQSYKKETTKSVIDIERNRVAANPFDDDVIKEALNNQKVAYLQTAEGDNPATIENDLKKLTSDTHSLALTRLVDGGNDMAAKSYFEKHQAQFYGDDVNRAKKLMESATMAGESQRMSDSIFVKNRDIGNALNEAMKIEDPKLRDETVKRVKDRFSIKEMIEKEREETNFKQADKLLAQSGDTDKIPRSLWNTFTATEQEKLEKLAKHKREGTEPETDWQEYYNLKQMASDPKLKDKFAQASIVKDYRDKLADPELKELIKLQTGVKNKDTDVQKLLDGFRGDQEIVNSAIKQLGISPTSTDKDELQTIIQLRKRVGDEQIKLQQATGKVATSKDMEAIVDKLMIQGVTEEGWFSDTRKRKFELLPGEQVIYKMKDVPAEELAAIKFELSKRKIPITDEKILELYRAGAQ